MRVKPSSTPTWTRHSTTSSGVIQLPEAIRAEMCLADWYDPWGTNIGWLFALNDVADALHQDTSPTFNRGAVARPNMADFDPDGEFADQTPYENCRLHDLWVDGVLSADDIARALEVLDELDDQLRSLGCSY